MDICAFELNVLTIIGWIVMKFGSDIHVEIPSNVGSLLNFHIASPSGQICHSFNTSFYDHILAKLMTLPSTSAVVQARL